jgi:hypothetical protein
MRLILISGDGAGAGKTTLARRLARRVLSLADALRDELTQVHPTYDWFRKDQQYKDSVPVPEMGGRTVREAMIQWGQDRCRADEAYWAKRLVPLLHVAQEGGETAIAVDDVRKLVELQFIRVSFPEALHVHVSWPGAAREPHYQNDELRDAADYVVCREPTADVWYSSNSSLYR